MCAIVIRVLYVTGLCSLSFFVDVLFDVVQYHFYLFCTIFCIISSRRAAITLFTFTISFRCCLSLACIVFVLVSFFVVIYVRYS